jgi:hypothetical protein
LTERGVKREREKILFAAGGVLLDLPPLPFFSEFTAILGF